MVAALPAVRVMVPDTALVSPVAPKLSVQLPVGPLIARPLNAAAPFDPVVADGLSTVAPLGPDAIVAVTTVPLWLTGLPLTSWTWSTGCCANAAPLCAVFEGWVVMPSWVAAPAVMGIVVGGGGAGPGALG